MGIRTGVDRTVPSLRATRSVASNTVGPSMPYLEPGDTFILEGHWFDGPPGQHKEIKAELDLRFVAPDGSTGPATRFSLISEPTRKTDGEGISR